MVILGSGWLNELGRGI